MKTKSLFSRTFEKLTVKRVNPDETLFCTCSGRACGGMGTRECTRTQLLTKAVGACRVCAQAARFTANKPVTEPIAADPPQTKPKICTGYVKDGFRYCGIDCPRHPMFPVDVVRTARKHAPIITGFL